MALGFLTAARKMTLAAKAGQSSLAVAARKQMFVGWPETTADFESLLPFFHLLQTHMFTSLLPTAGVPSVRFGEGLLRSSGHELVTLVAFEKATVTLGRIEEGPHPLNAKGRIHKPGRHPISGIF